MTPETSSGQMRHLYNWSCTKGAAAEKLVSDLGQNMGNRAVGVGAAGAAATAPKLVKVSTATELHQKRSQKV